MSYIIPTGNGSFVSAKNGWFCVSCAVTRESLGYYSWIMVGYRVPGYLTVGRRDAYWASGKSAVTNSLLLSVLWVVGTFGADRNVQHWAEPRQSAGVGNSTGTMVVGQ